MHLFSFSRELFDFARQHYRVRSKEGSTLLAQLLDRYRVEGLEMPFDFEKYIKDIEERLKADMTLEERLAGLTVEQRLAGLRPEERLKGLAPEQRLAGLSEEERNELLRLLQGEQPADPS